MTEDYVINIDTDYTDDIGNQLLWSNDVLSLYYYDATTSGSVENWTKNWDVINPVFNNKFNNAEPGTNWTLVTDDLEEPYTTEISRYANWHNTDLLYGMSTTSSGYTHPWAPDRAVDYNIDYGYETSSGTITPGEHAVRVDMGSIQDVNYSWFIPCWDTDVTKAVKEYRIGVSDTGGEDEFTIVASGTTVSGSYAPVIDFLGNIQTRYVKFYIDSNWGHVSRSRLFRWSAFYEPDWSMYGYWNEDFTDGSDAYWQQVVDLAGVDYLFVDARAMMTNSAQVGQMTVMASGVGGSTDDELQNYDWGSTGTGWLDSTDTIDGLSHWTRWEEQIDVSSYGGDTALKLRLYNESVGRRYFFGYFDNIVTQPLWYSEQSSTYRGNKSSFPDETYLVSDRNGLSIINKEDMSLWMRFQVGPGNMLESTARDVVAKNGCIFMATTRGLVIIDFENNRAWKIDEVGVYYRMSLGRRNEYGKWFEETTSHKLPTNDVYSVDFGGYAGDFFVVVGHGYGMTYVETPTVLATRVVNSSSFTYPVRKIKTFSDSNGATERMAYVGGYDLKARVGIMEDIGATASGTFDDQIVFFHSDGMTADALVGNISEQWEVKDGNIPFLANGDYTTISGIKDNYGSSTLLQKNLAPDQPFTASMQVKIDKWPERGEGGFHFGVTSGWPVTPILYEVTSQALSLSAINGVRGAIIEDEKFLTFPDQNNWMLTFNDTANSQVLTENGAFKIYGQISNSSGKSIVGITALGHLRVFTARTFTAKVKVKCTQFDVSPDNNRQSAIVFGISDGDYVGGGSDNNLLCMTLYSHFTDANPPVYAVAYTGTYDRLYWDTTTTLPTFIDDMTEDADWHQWEFTFDADTETINAAVDGLFVGEYTYTAMGSEIGIFMGVGGNVFNSYNTAYFKDFEVDFGENPSYASREFITQTYDDGIYTIPTVSGTHINGLPFSVNDGTYTSNWRTWLLEYDGTTLSGSIDGQSAGAPVTLGLGNNNQRIFVHYDQPALVSGTDDQRDVDIKIRDFNIEYTSDNAVISGSPNNFWLENGSYLSMPYNSLYIATSSGVQQLRYDESTSVSGTPVGGSTYGITDSQFGSGVLYGNINNTSSVEVEPGAVGNNGLLYTGSSRYSLRGWERLIDRTGPIDAGMEVGITVSPDGTRIYQSYNFAGNYIYFIDTGVISSSWVLFTVGDYPEGFSSLTNERAYIIDMQDGHLYGIANGWFGIYSKKDTKWLTPTENIGIGQVSGIAFNECEVAPIYSRSAIFILSYGDTAFMPLAFREWTAYFWQQISSPTYIASAVVYSDVDDSIYSLTYGSSGNFQRMPMDTQIFSDSLEDCPFPYDFNDGISAFYRPYDESIYFVMKGLTQEYGRRVLRYDVKAQVWTTWGEDFPATVYDYMTAAYAFEEDAIYVIAGTESATMYKYYFPRDEASRFVYWSADDSILPEYSVLARFKKIAFNTDAGNPSDSFSDSKISPQWFQNIFGTNGTITEGSGGVNIVCDYISQSANTNLVRAIPVPACDFTATAQVRVNDMARSTGALANSRNMFMFGITDFIGTPGLRAGSNDVSVGLSMVGVNGLFMTATNDEADDVNKYSLYKAELATDTFYNASQYQSFSAEDATGAAEFKEWRIEYDHAAKQFDAYIDGTSVGTTTLTGEGFTHGASLYLGHQRVLNAISGTLDVDVKDLSVVVSGTSSFVSDYMEIDDDDEYGYVGYEKFDSTITSGTGYTLESDWRIDTYSLSNNEYVTTVGSMEDGQKQATVVALHTGSKEIGVYTGGDPRLSSSYMSVVHDWTVRTTYKVVSDTSTVGLYIDGASTPSVSVSYDSLPDSEYRRCRFGSLNPDNTNFAWSSNRNAHKITISGSWSQNYQETSFYGRNHTINTDSVDDKIILTFDDTGGGYLYMFYSVATSRSVAVPITVYHQGVVEIPTPDSFATNPIVSVTDNEDEFGNTNANATKIVLSQERYTDGSYYDRVIRQQTEEPSGWVYLGRYTNIDRVVVTSDGSGTGVTNEVDVDSFLIKHTDTQPRSRSVSRVYGVGYTLGVEEVKRSTDYQGGFTVVDMNEKTQIDAYSDETSPSIIDGNVYDFDVIQ